LCRCALGLEIEAAQADQSEEAAEDQDPTAAGYESVGLYWTSRMQLTHSLKAPGFNP
jgi:hypothetical protein